ASVPCLVYCTLAGAGSFRQAAYARWVGPAPCRPERYAELASASGNTPLTPREGPSGIAFGIAAREPVGVVACITPYNFPMTNCAGKIGPALARGNPGVVKPAPVHPPGVRALWP